MPAKNDQFKAVHIVNEKIGLPEGYRILKSNKGNIWMNIFIFIYVFVGLLTFFN